MSNYTRTRRTLPWPMSLVERDILHELWQHSQKTGTPITAIVKAAIDAHLTHLLDASAPMPTARVAEPIVAYQINDSVSIPTLAP